MHGYIFCHHLLLYCLWLSLNVIDRNSQRIQLIQFQGQWPVFDEELLVVWNFLKGAGVTQSMLCCVMGSTDNILKQTIDYGKQTVRINIGSEQCS